jgi:uncharacterized protein (DUF1330 family)
MTAFVISEIEDVDPALIDQYRAMAQVAIPKHGGRYIVRGGAIETVEGAWAPKQIVIVEFPTIEQARVWYRSADYAQALKLRQTALRRRLIFVEGVASA